MLCFFWSNCNSIFYSSGKRKKRDFRDLFLRQVVSAVAMSAGYHEAEDDALTVLVDVLYDTIQELCLMIKNYAEHCNRTQVTVSDFITAVDSSRKYSLKFPRSMNELSTKYSLKYPPTFKVSGVKETTILRGSEPQPHPPYVPDFLPPFPNPHTYISTSVGTELRVDYEHYRKIEAARNDKLKQSVYDLVLRDHPSVTVRFEDFQLRALLREQVDDTPLRNFLSRDPAQNNNNNNNNVEPTLDETVNNPYIKERIMVKEILNRKRCKLT
ncbi:Transcription initiation factor TFIID subunit 8 [Trichinella pseudospiralis]|uniref:Transcription initiation factor TFIID subunit 8 n=1 Tax=Trichinella pseudospiralis TaxID=6337 RepID=A0A0V1FIE1_TRIPS|nr:Transcription initiation factor TFIID subunit 8 [Trichinella pseudospiralis]